MKEGSRCPHGLYDFLYFHILDVTVEGCDRMNGILPLWKEQGMTSHDCVFQLRKIVKTKKVGHTGTLDPNVEGVLPICIGQSTKVAEYITDTGKEYVATISIGTATETEDRDGAVVAADQSMKTISRQEIEHACQQLTGQIEQIPPMYSAVKVNGKRLYEYARKGIEVERPKRIVTIESIELESPETQFKGMDIQFDIRVACGKGTYIRTLAVQLGELLGYPAHMAALVRTRSGSFQQSDCLTIEQVRAHMEQGDLDNYLKPLEHALDDFPFIEVDVSEQDRILNGQVLPAHPRLHGASRIVFTIDEKAVAVYQRHPEKKGMMKPEKMFPRNG